MISISRITTAFILVSAIILSSIAGFAQTTQTVPSTNKTESTTQSQDQTATNATAKNDTTSATKAPPPLPAKSNSRR